MIIATIGHDDFLIESLEKAEQLLRILSAATPVEIDYRLNGNCYPGRPFDVSIKITAGELISKEQAAQLIEEYDAKRRARDEQA